MGEGDTLACINAWIFLPAFLLKIRRCQMYDRGGSWDASRKEGEHCKSGTTKGAGFPWQHGISYVERTSAGRPQLYCSNPVTVILLQYVNKNVVKATKFIVKQEREENGNINNRVCIFPNSANLTLWQTGLLLKFTRMTDLLKLFGIKVFSGFWVTALASFGKLFPSLACSSSQPFLQELLSLNSSLELNPLL